MRLSGRSASETNVLLRLTPSGARSLVGTLSLVKQTCLVMPVDAGCRPCVCRLPGKAHCQCSAQVVPDLKRPPHVQMRFYCPYAFLRLDFRCRMNGFYTFGRCGIKKSAV